MKCLPAAADIPPCLKALQFEEFPTEAELQKRFRQLSKVAHPDSGGSEAQFIALKTAYDEARKLIQERENND